MKKIFLSIAFFISVNVLFAQSKYMTKAGNISFHSKAKLESIDGKSNTVTSIITSGGDVAFSVLIKSFKFKQSLMEEHFNENYLESSKAGMDKSTFKGKIVDVSKVNFTKDGTYNVSVKGDLTMHGVKQSVTTPGTITVKGDKINATCAFKVKLADYKITIPSAVKDNISESVEITVNSDYDKMK